MKPEKQLYQWDTNQSLVELTPSAQFVDYPIGDEVIRIEADGTRCRIPDEVLQTYGGKTCYERYPDGTYRAYSFTVLYAPKPPEYVYTPEERTTFEALTARVDAAIAEIKRRADSGEFTPVKGVDYFTNAEKAEMMESVSDGAIGEFRKVVDSATTEYNANAAEKLTTYDTNAEQHTTDYNRNAEQKLEAYNQNHTEKVAEYNQNAETKTAEFDANADALQTEVDRLTSEIVDARYGADGVTYPSLGAAIRVQVTDLKSDLSQIISYRQTEQEYNASGYTISDNWDSSGAGGYYDANGRWTPNDSYRWFRIDAVRDNYNLYTRVTTGVNFIHVFDGEPSDSTFVTKYRSIDNNLPTESNKATIQSGQVVIIQNTSSSGIKVVCSNKAEYVFGEKLEVLEAISNNPLFMRKMKVAWFGDSISQFQLLPHRVAEYMGITVNDCSFAGAPLTYSTEAYQGTGFMSLTSQIVSKDFTELENSLSKQDSVSEDKRGNANRLESLDFSTITDIVVMAGTNDVNNDYVATSTDLTKFKNGIRTAINTIQTAYPQINLYFISDPYRGDVITDKNGNALADFIQAEKEVCEEKNIPFYDLYHNSGINANTIAYYLTSDKLHQNENGDILMAKKIAKWLMSN